VVLACYPKDAGSIKQEDYGAGQPGQKVRLYLQNNQSKKGRCSSALQVKNPKFKSQYRQKNPKAC
jgi:hypothetical protein